MTAPNVKPVRDRQTITLDGRATSPLIEGVVVRRLPAIEDRRGEIVELYDPAWGLHETPLVYAYQIGVRRGAIKGWVVHREQDDRICISRGVLRWVLFDDRADSPTRGMLNDLVFSDRNRALLLIPRGVYHAVRNIGETEATFINFPSSAYDKLKPDKYRLPLKNDLIPFTFDDGPGW